MQWREIESKTKMEDKRRQKEIETWDQKGKLARETERTRKKTVE